MSIENRGLIQDCPDVTVERYVAPFQDKNNWHGLSPLLFSAIVASGSL